MGKVTVKIRCKSDLGLIEQSVPRRIEAEYVGRYRKAVICIRESFYGDGYVAFEVQTGRAIKDGQDFKEVKQKAFELIENNYVGVEKLIDRLAPLYGEICFAFNGNEILGNTLMDQKVYRKCMKRTNGRYKEIADKVLNKDSMPKTS
ncbi:hypothetical protein M670_00154 [Schinkia azotoformans MEV2011]|uniref:Uncharacterized protein n=1 Tax=Schinkia azotoformans MEV2011 TaxID=1348973 RepID=A0A072NTH0_SCHAZ|nr:hypothetical protein [Schinkia azotoformans]KEF40138.1 hypothetical protein M670_00154 [Schinkia azotoformans MEV2011]